MGDTLHPLRYRSAVKFICTDGKERIGTTEKRMNTANQKEKNLLAESVEKGELSHLFASYIDYCADKEKIPNLAGFCRYFGGSMSEWKSVDGIYGVLGNKKDNWCYGSGDFIIHCTDGDLEK